MSDFAAVKSLIEDQGKAWNEYQKANDAKIEAIQKGLPTGELQAKIDLISKEMTEQQKAFRELEKKAYRPKAGDVELTSDQVEYAKAFNHYLRTGDGDRSLKELGKKAMNTSSDTDGGYTVLPEMDRTIERIAGTVSAMYRLADNITISSAKWSKLMKTSGMAMRRVGEGQTGGESGTPKYQEVSIDVFPAEVEPWVYNETLEDSFVNLEADLADEAGIAFGEGFGAEFVTGNGVAKARGITAYTNVINSSYSWGNVGYIPSGAAGAFAASAPADKVISLQHSLKSTYRPGAVWITNDATLGLLRQMKDGSGAYYLWNPDPAGGFGGRLLGNPVEVDDNMPDVAAGSFSLAFGNFKRAYKIVNRAGISLIRDNITTKGQTKFNFRKRAGGGIYNYEALKLMRFATS